MELMNGMKLDLIILGAPKRVSKSTIERLQKPIYTSMEKMCSVITATIDLPRNVQLKYIY